MRTLSPTSIAGRFVAVLILITLGLTAYAVLVVPYINSLGQARAAVEAAREQRDRLAAMAAQRPAFEAELKALRATDTVRMVTIQAENHALATAAFQGHVLETFERNGAAVSRVTAYEPRDSAGREVRIGASVSGTLDSLTRALSKLEGGTPAGYVRSVTMNTPRRAPGGAETEPEDAPARSLTMTVEVIGFMDLEEAS